MSLSVLLSIVLVGGVGALMERLAIWPARRSPALTLTIITVGVYTVMWGAALLVWGSSPYQLPAFYHVAAERPDSPLRTGRGAGRGVVDFRGHDAARRRPLRRGHDQGAEPVDLGCHRGDSGRAGLLLRTHPDGQGATGVRRQPARGAARRHSIQPHVAAVLRPGRRPGSHRRDRPGAGHCPNVRHGPAARPEGIRGCRHGRAGQFDGSGGRRPRCWACSKTWPPE